ncbi:MAG: ExbD/TolR family protein, partial [Flavobacteriales bacterium]
YVGPPVNEKYGTSPRIQLDDAFATVEEVQPYIKRKREQRDEDEIPMVTTSLKVDKDTKMGIVTDIKQELREIRALKINYSTHRRADKY